jgi:hypothetical protein
MYDEDTLVVESRAEPAHSDQIPLPTDDYWFHRIGLGGGCFLASFRMFGVTVIGFSPANGLTRSHPAHYPVDEIYKYIRSAKPDTITADTCFAAIKLLKETLDKETE